MGKFLFFSKLKTKQAHEGLKQIYKIKTEAMDNRQLYQVTENQFIEFITLISFQT